jgi:hypothetical protein
MRRWYVQMIQRPMSAFISSVELLMQPSENRQKADGLISRFIHTLSRPQTVIDSGETRATEETFELSEEKESSLQETKETILSSPAILNTFAPSRWSAKEIANSSTTVAPKDDDSATINPEERRKMNKDLHDDMLKLVRFKVLFVKREDERVLAEGDELVPDNMDSTAFTAWKIAQLQGTDKLKGISDEDKKYLRVYYEVLDRYPREKFKYEEEQIDVLKEIRNKIECKE